MVRSLCCCSYVRGKLQRSTWGSANTKANVFRPQVFILFFPYHFITGQCTGDTFASNLTINVLGNNCKMWDLIIFKPYDRLTDSITTSCPKKGWWFDRLVKVLLSIWSIISAGKEILKCIFYGICRQRNNLGVHASDAALHLHNQWHSRIGDQCRLIGQGPPAWNTKFTVKIKNFKPLVFWVRTPLSPFVLNMKISPGAA